MTFYPSSDWTPSTIYCNLCATAHRGRIGFQDPYWAINGTAPKGWLSYAPGIVSPRHERTDLCPRCVRNQALRSLQSALPTLREMSFTLTKKKKKAKK